VEDSSTVKPLADAIAYILNSSFGASTDSGGAFRLAGIPAGAHDLVVSHIGYERRVVSIPAAAAQESVYVEILMVPRAIPANAIEVLAPRNRETPLPPAHPDLFFPRSSPGTYCMYGTGSTIPIGLFFSDSVFSMYALDTAIVDSEKYLRL